jgi:hypothetical protein
MYPQINETIFTPHNINGKSKVVTVLLAEYHAMKAYWGAEV